MKPEIENEGGESEKDNEDKDKIESNREETKQIQSKAMALASLPRVSEIISPSLGKSKFSDLHIASLRKGKKNRLRLNSTSLRVIFILLINI